MVLSRGGDFALDGEVIEEGDDLRLAHFFGVPLAVKEDVPIGPAEVGLFGADAVVLAADEVAHVPKQLGFANDLIRIHGDMSIAVGRSCGSHALRPSLDFLNGFRILACCCRIDSRRLRTPWPHYPERLRYPCFALRPWALWMTCSEGIFTGPDMVPSALVCKPDLH